MRTLIIIKPGGVTRGLIGEALGRFERFGIRFVGIKLLRMEKERAELLYAVHKGKPFFSELITYITSSPVLIAVLDIDLGPDDGIKLVRKVIGATNPLEAAMGTLRGDFGLHMTDNIIHASDSEKSAEYEIPIFFDEDELITR